ncbi:hypothetical protein AB7C87_01840 [Natrarchaeobius sp. A-rgal3]|uniref:hypothetical protein n=1 Tax=Natrarchaeobius versutus TaxID=1679078 RepID=UPI003510D100
MGRNQTRPMTDDEIAKFEENIEKLRTAVRQNLAEDFGGEPDNYRAEKLVPDGSDN